MIGLCVMFCAGWFFGVMSVVSSARLDTRWEPKLTTYLWIIPVFLFGLAAIAMALYEGFR